MACLGPHGRKWWKQHLNPALGQTHLFLLSLCDLKQATQRLVP